MLQARSKVAFISCTRAHSVLFCDITVANGAALLIDMLVAAMGCTGKFYLSF